MAACRSGNLDSVKSPVNRGANLQPSFQGRHAHVIALAQAHPHFVRWLLVQRHTEYKAIGVCGDLLDKPVYAWSGPAKLKLQLVGPFARAEGQSLLDHVKHVHAEKLRWKTLCGANYVPELSFEGCTVKFGLASDQDQVANSQPSSQLEGPKPEIVRVKLGDISDLNLVAQAAVTNDEVASSQKENTIVSAPSRNSSSEMASESSASKAGDQRTDANQTQLNSSASVEKQEPSSPVHAHPVPSANAEQVSNTLSVPRLDTSETEATDRTQSIIPDRAGRTKLSDRKSRIGKKIGRMFKKGKKEKGL